jgi:hypothetical protein
MKSFGIYELYRRMAEEQTTRETARIAAPDRAQQREKAILAERARFAALMVNRLPTPEEAAAHGASIKTTDSGATSCWKMPIRATRISTSTSFTDRLIG